MHAISIHRRAESIVYRSHPQHDVDRGLHLDVIPRLELVGGRHSHRGAQAKLRAAVHSTRISSFSITMWYNLAEIQVVLTRDI